MNTLYSILFFSFYVEEDLSAESLSEREDSQSEAEYETCDSGVSEQSSGSSDQYPSKRKKRHHATIDVESGIVSHRATTRYCTP